MFYSVCVRNVDKMSKLSRYKLKLNFGELMTRALSRHLVVCRPFCSPPDTSQLLLLSEINFVSPDLCLCCVAEIKASVRLRSSSRPYADRTEVCHFKSHAANIPQRLEGRLVGSLSHRL